MQVTEEVLGVVPAVASRFARPGTERFDELVAAGNLALVLALAKYDPEKDAGGRKHLLYVAVRNDILTHLRSFHGRHAGHAPFDESLAPPVGDDTAQNFRFTSDDLMGLVPEEDREFVWAYCVEGAPLGTLAKTYGTTGSMLAQRFRRAMGKARAAAEGLCRD